MIALQHRPELLILDEPTSGLDPLVQQSFYELVREAQAEGRTVFLSSHILSEVEKTCDRVAIIRDGALVKVDRTDALRDLAHHEVELRFADGAVPADAFASLPGVSDVQLDRPHAPDAGQRPDHAGRPGRRALRAARLREPRAVARGDVPRAVRHGARRRRCRHDRRHRAGGHAPAGRRPRPFSRIYGLGSVYAKTLRDSRLALIIVCGLIGASSSRAAIAFGEAYTTVESRLELKALVSALPPAMAGVYGNPFPTAIETLGGSIAWKTAASLGLMAALWSVLALSGTIASEVRRGSIEFVATTPLGKRRIALEKLAAHVTGMAIVVLVTAVCTYVAGTFGTLPGDAISWTLGVRVRPVGRRRRAGLGIHRLRARPVRRSRRLGGDRGRGPPVRLLRQRLPGRGTGLRAVREPDLVGLDRPPPAARQPVRLGVARPGRRADGRRCSRSGSSPSRAATSARSADPVAADCPRSRSGLGGPFSRSLGERLPLAFWWGIGIGLLGFVFGAAAPSFSRDAAGPLARHARDLQGGVPADRPPVGRRRVPPDRVHHLRAHPRGLRHGDPRQGLGVGRDRRPARGPAVDAHVARHAGRSAAASACTRRSAS